MGIVTKALYPGLNGRHIPGVRKMPLLCPATASNMPGHGYPEFSHGYLSRITIRELTGFYVIPDKIVQANIERNGSGTGRREKSHRNG